MLLDLDFLTEERIVEIAKVLGYAPGYDYPRETKIDYFTVDLRKISADHIMSLKKQADQANEDLRRAQKTYMNNLYDWLKNTNCVRFAEREINNDIIEKCNKLSERRTK